MKTTTVNCPKCHTNVIFNTALELKAHFDECNTICEGECNRPDRHRDEPFYHDFPSGCEVCIPAVKYYPNDDDQTWWCNTHNRRATYLFDSPKNGQHRVHRCDPKLGGIMIACNAVNITDILEIE